MQAKWPAAHLLSQGHPGPGAPPPISNCAHLLFCADKEMRGRPAHAKCPVIFILLLQISYTVILF